jgi:hypothetical protein
MKSLAVNRFVRLKLLGCAPKYSPFLYNVYNSSTFRQSIWKRQEIVAHLTKAVVEAAKAPMRGQRFIRDDAIKGFALRVIASGAKSFVWEGRVNGRGAGSP